MIIVYNTLNDPGPGGGSDPDTPETDTDENNGTLILDATCGAVEYLLFAGCQSPERGKGKPERDR